MTRNSPGRWRFFGAQLAFAFAFLILIPPVPSETGHQARAMPAVLLAGASFGLGSWLGHGAAPSRTLVVLRVVFVMAYGWLLAMRANF